MSAPTHSAAAPHIPSAEEHFINVDGIRLRYLRAGRGTPLLLIHGLLGYSFCWRRNFEALGRHFDVIAPDLPGIGFSERPPGLDCSLRAAAGRILRLLDALGIEQADVIGNSHGGAIAATVAATSRQQGARRVRRLVLVSPVNPWSSHGRWITAFLAGGVGRTMFPAIWVVLSRLHGFGLRRMYGDAKRITPGTLDGYDVGVAQPGTRDYLLGVVRCWHTGLRELEQVYAAIDVATLLLWGDRDRAVLPASAKQVQRAVRGAELVFLQGAGHIPQEEVPDDFHRIVLDFLRRH